MAEAAETPGAPRQTGPPSSATQAWRREGEPLFAVLFLVVFAVEAILLGALTWALLFSSQSRAVTGLRNVLIAAVSSAALLLTVATVSILLFRAVSGRRQRRREEEIRAWLGVWRQVLSGASPPPAPPLSEPAVAALLDLRETVGGEDSQRAAGLISELGAADSLLATVRSASAQPGRYQRVAGRLGASRRLASLLSALDGLAKARVPEAVDAALPLVDSDEPAVRTLALRAVARSVAAIPEPSARDAAATSLARPLSTRRFSRGSLDEAFLLLEEGARGLIVSVVDDPSSDPTLVASALDSAGRLGLSDLTPLICTRLTPRELPEVQAAALRSLTAFPRLPDEARERVRIALRSKEDIVRIQAAHAGHLLKRDEVRSGLMPLLGDRNWWVRRAAATSLAKAGDEGMKALRWAAVAHPDRYARDVANEVLNERSQWSPREVA